MGNGKGMGRREFLRLAGTAAAATAATVALGGCSTGEAETTEDTLGVPGWQEVNISKEVDVLIIGAGGAGLCAAMNTTKAGLSTLLVDKAATYGGVGNTAAGISVWPAGSKYMQDRGVTATTDESWEKIAGYYATLENPPRLYESLGKDIYFTEVELHDALYDLGVKWMEMPADDGVRPTPGSGGKSYFAKWFIPSAGLGSYNEVYKAINDSIVAAGAEFYFNTTVTDFIVDGAGQAVGVRCKDSMGSVTDIRATVMLIASGGFISNQPLIAQYLGEWAELPTVVHTSMGEGILLGQTIGAALEGMENYNTLDPSMAVLTCTAYFGPTYQVAQNGKRFCREVDQHGMGEAIIEAGQVCWWSIWDDTLATSQFKSVIDQYFADGGVTANTVEELAAATAIPVDTLKATFAEYEALAAANEDPAFKRARFNDVLKPPYYALRSVPVRYKTQGGLRINGSGQVVDENDTVIPNVWAAGALTPHCTSDIAPTMGMGYLVGKNIVTALAG